VPFTKLTATLKTSPNTRDQIRDIVERDTTSLIEALNDFITEAMANTPQQTTHKLVLIVDSLDRIPPILRKNLPSNHEQIFIGRNDQLRMLSCHVIYTVPISLVYSAAGADAWDVFDGGEITVLPMVMVRDQAGQVCEAGLETMRDLVGHRVFHPNGLTPPDRQLVGDIFDEAETLD
jgi:hypothetical protein